MKSSDQPNILLFLTDEHAQWALGCYGNQEIRTPTLDYLASQGVQMMNAFTPTPVCSPARACLLTGRYASQHGLHDYLNSDDPEINDIDWLAGETSVAQLLQQAGYQTALSGKWHLGKDEYQQAGYDHWFTLGRGYPIYHQGPHEYGFEGAHHKIPGRLTDVITDRALGFLEAFDERPFFLQVGYYATHSPWEAQAERLVASYRDCTFNDIPTDEMYLFGHQNLESRNDTRNNPREALAQYYAAVTEIDNGIGRLVDYLESRGQLDNTLIIYTSDHGLNCGHHGIWGKGNGTWPLNFVEESIRVPLIFTGLDHVFGGQRRGELTDHLDTFQTILAAADVTMPNQNYAGRSQWPLLADRQTEPAWRTWQFCEYGDVQMWRNGYYKYVYRHGDGAHELFDLRTDPREETNLYDEPGYQTLQARLETERATHFEKYAVPQKSGLLGSELSRHNETEAWRYGGVFQ